MRTQSRSPWLFLLLIANTIGHAQDPLNVINPDVSFVPQLHPLAADVRDILPLADGRILVANSSSAPQIGYSAGTLALLPNGQQDPGFTPLINYYELHDWNDEYFYAKGGSYGGGFARFNKVTGEMDMTFDIQANAPDLTIFIIEDAFVFDDGSLLLGGNFSFSTPGMPFSCCLVRLTSTGAVDTTWQHRICDQQTIRIFPLENDGYLVSGVHYYMDSSLVPHTFKIHSDGSFDTSFYTSHYWGYAYAALERTDGNIIGVGRFMYGADNLGLIRWSPNGDLDQSFNNYNYFLDTEYPNQFSYVMSAVPSISGEILVSGYFQTINGMVRSGIALFADDGTLLQDAFSATGFVPDGMQRLRVQLRPDGPNHLYAYGIFDGYISSDGTHDLPRLIRFNRTPVSVVEHDGPQLRAYPTPASTKVIIEGWSNVPPARIDLLGMDGRSIRSGPIVPDGERIILDVIDIPSGAYVCRAILKDGAVHSIRIIISR